MRHRVVITGIGVVSPIGTGKRKFWKALIAGQSGIACAKKIDTSKYRTHMAAEVKDFNPNDFLRLKGLDYPTTTTLYALASVAMAIEDSGLKIDCDNRVGIVLGANTPDPSADADSIYFWNKHKYSHTPARIYRNLHTNLHVVKSAEYFSLKGPVSVIPAACAAGNTAISYAFDMISSGLASAMFAGGCDPMNHLAYGGFDKMKAMSPDYCQPFDKDRKGMVVGEGAGIILLEDMGFALKRKAKIYAEMLGYGLATDGYNVAIPHPEALGGILAAKMALRMAKVRPQNIDYINAHGTGTVANDRMESYLIKKVFKDNGNDVPVSSIKSMLGHCMGAASGIEACASALIIQNDIIPPNINYQRPDPFCDINVVANKAVAKKINIMLSNSFAFGGNNSVIAIAKFNDN